MIDPKSVIAPQNKWAMIDVLCQKGGPNQNWWSMAIGRWEGDPCLGLRWNGDESDDSKGSPTSRGYPTWFVVPQELVPALMEFIPPEKRPLATHFLGDVLKAA